MATRMTFCLVVNIWLLGCGGSDPPPAHPPKIEAIRPTAEKAPPPAAVGAKEKHP